MNVWEEKAEAAALAYHQGHKHDDYPAPLATGSCGQAARALWEDVNSRDYPYRRGSATLMWKAAAQAGKAITGPDAYHKAAARGAIKPGAQLYFGGNGGLGHVVTVVSVVGDPGTSGAGVTIFENTSRKSAGEVLGTHVGLLVDVLAIHGGSAGVVAVVNV